MNRDHDLALADERAADDRYRSALHRMDRTPRPLVARARPAERNLPPGAGPGAGRLRGLLGRVALAHETDFMDGTDYYIGSRYLDGGRGLTVFSWTAPIARTFFQGRGQHDLCASVAAVRTFERRAGRICGFTDDPGPALSDGPAFTNRALSMTPAPGGGNRYRKPKAPARGSTPPPLPTPAHSPELPVEPPCPAVAPAPALAPDAPPLRAEHAVRAAVVAPRGERLTSVLATLQADQYELVAADPHTPLVVQGHPGTGKTVVAAHRAAYLVHPDTDLPPVDRVLVVGPTEHYVRHVSGVLAELVDEPDAVRAASMDDVLLDLRGISVVVDDGVAQEAADTDSRLLSFALRAATLLRGNGRLGRRMAHAEGVRLVYEALRSIRVGSQWVTTTPEWVGYLSRLPDFRAATRMRRHLPLLAACGVGVAGGAPYTVDHVVVDEAQDVTPLEWALLRLVVPSGSWTLLGDMNQRRSELSCRSWTDVRVAVEAPSLRVATLGRGYRTTSAIMRFAGRLLGRAAGTVDSLQDGGSEPSVHQVPAAELHTRVRREAVSMLDRHPGGTVAVITTTPRDIERALRRAHFRVDPQDPSRLIGDTGTIRVLDPHQARGLEFDAVVVVDPNRFVVRQKYGLLYTSLTRANRELAIVHSQKLPHPLRPQPVVIPAQRPAPTPLVPEFRAASG